MLMFRVEPLQQNLQKYRVGLLIIAEMCLLCARARGSLPGILSQPMPMEQDRGGEEEDAPAPYMPIVPQGMSPSAPAPQVTPHTPLYTLKFLITFLMPVGYAIFATPPLKSCS